MKHIFLYQVIQVIKGVSVLSCFIFHEQFYLSILSNSPLGYYWQLNVLEVHWLNHKIKKVIKRGLTMLKGRVSKFMQTIKLKWWHYFSIIISSYLLLYCVYGLYTISINAFFRRLVPWRFVIVHIIINTVESQHEPKACNIFNH